MKISLKWLGQLVDLGNYAAMPGDLAKVLTSAGLEVESIQNSGEALKNVFVGELIEVGRHPNADRLTVCQVDLGEGKLRQIVCGAKNHKAGDKVAVAIPGAVLPGNFVIKESKIRDVESLGMLCSESELGLKDESEGILILNQEAKVGLSFVEWQGLDDVIMELNVTPNRADCLSHLGLARELSSLLERPLNWKASSVEGRGAKTVDSVQVSLEAQTSCPRYSARVIRGVRVGPSPDWLKRRLAAVDINSINNVVDITNYVMLELGQPLHAFDLKNLKGQKMFIREATPGEVFETLDGSKLKLEGFELTIRDSERAVALAGVVGGKNSGVSENTTDVVLESAHFAADSVRKTMRHHGIMTDSSYRFSRGTDPEGVIWALDRATELLAELASGVAAPDHIDSYPRPLEIRPIEVSAAYVAQRLGFDVAELELHQTLSRLHCKVQKGERGGELRVTPPAFRCDLSHKVDLVEEFARVKGYDQIPETFPALVGSPLNHAIGFRQGEALSELAKGQGYLQARNYGFYSEREAERVLGSLVDLKDLGLDSGAEPVRIKNPLNEELGMMRGTLLYWLIKNLIHNYRYGAESGRLFEMGSVFGRDNQAYVESSRLSLLGWGQRSTLWSREASRPVVFDLKASVEGVLEQLLIQRSSIQWIVPAKVPKFLHPGRVSVLQCEGRAIGFIGALHPALLDQEKVRVDAAVAEIDVDKLLRGWPRLAKSRTPAKFPQVQRDLAVIVSDKVRVAEIEREVRKSLGKLLQNFEVFDEFRGQGIPEGSRSLTFRMWLQSDSGTLSDQEIQTQQSNLVETLKKKLGISVR